jgi:hypothetical protein
MKLLTAPTDAALSEIYRTWARELSDLPEFAIRFGLSRCKDFKGWFSLPAFRELCHASAKDLGMPDPHAAYLEAARADGPRDRIRWSHPAVYHAACETGWFELRSMTEKECFPLYRRNYEAMVARVMAGEELSTPVQKVIPASIPQYLTTDENLARMAKLKELLA